MVDDPGFDHFDRIVAIGDLNGAHHVLRDILFGLELIDSRDRWIASRAHLVQIGDIFNRGPDARGAFKLLMSLQKQAKKKASQVTVLLGNHEVMTALGNEAYCTAEEYLSFATAKQKKSWPHRVDQAMRDIYHSYPEGGPVLPLGPRLEAWKVRNVPGRAALRRALGPRGEIGRKLRTLPIAVRSGGCVFSHATLTPTWARLGIDGLEAAVREAWQTAPAFFPELPRDHLFFSQKGPLWNRRLMRHETTRTRSQLDSSLKRLGVERMVVGHTPTDHIPGGEKGRITLRHDGKLVCIDVMLGRMEPSPRIALLIEKGRGVEWSPEGTRVLWRDRTTRRTRRIADNTGNAKG